MMFHNATKPDAASGAGADAGENDEAGMDSTSR